MRIAFDHSIFFQKYGGISRYFATIAAEFVDCNIQVGIFSPLYRNEYLKDLPEGVVHGMQFKTYPPKTVKIIQYLNYSINVNKIRRFKPEILHQTYYNKHNYKEQKYKRVITVFDLIHEIYCSEDPKMQSFLQEKKHSIENAEHIICISEHTKSDLQKFYAISDDKITVTHLGVRAKPMELELSKDYKIRANRPFLLYVGERSGYKNFLGFIQGFSFSHRLMGNFDIVAFGGGKFTNKELNFINTLGFREGQVNQISGSDFMLSRYFQSAAAFIYPSLYEGFGLPPLEAMSFGCPVIVSDRSSIPEVVGNAGKYFDAKRPEDICSSIEEVVFCDNTMKKLIKNGHERINKFSWKKCAINTLEAYSTIL